jgi:hypothetical protein
MKSWEDILKGRFARHAEPGKPGQDEALWNAIEAGMAAPPTGAKAAGVATGVSGSAGKFWSWALGTAAVMGLVLLGVVFWPKAGPITPQEGTRVEQSQDVQSAPKTALDSEEGEGTPSVGEEVFPSASNEAASIQAAPNEADLTLPSAAEMAPEVSVAKAGSDAAKPEAAVAAETMTAEVGASVATAEVAPNVETRTTGAESAPTVSSEPTPTSATSDRLPFFLPRMEPDGEENVARARSVGGELPPREGPAEGMLEPLPLRTPSSDALPLAQLLPMGGAIEAEAPFALRTFGGPTLSHFSLKGKHPEELRGHFYTEFSAGGGVALDVRRWGQTFSLGLAWYDYVHLLDYVETTTQDYLDPEGIQSIEINALTGDTVAVLFGDVQGLATQRRYVRSFNRFNAVVIPVEWRTSRSLGRWHGGLGLGVQLLVRSGGRGHSLNEDGLVVAYADGDLPKSRLNWTPTGGLFAGYQVAPEWRLDLSVGAGIQRFRTRRTAEGAPEAPLWEGQLITGQIQCGVTRFFGPKGR